MNVPPFAYPPDVDEILAEQVFVLAIGELVCRVMATARVAQPLPQLQVSHKLAFFIVEFGVRLISLSLLVHWPITHVLHTQGTGNDQHLIKRLPVFGLQNHAANARIERQFRQRAPNRRELIVIVHRAKLGQQLVAVNHCAALRRFDKREVFNRTQMQRLHAQNHRCQRTAQNLGVGKALAARKVLRIVQTNANAIGNAAAATGALVGCRLADGFNHQLLNFAPETVALDPCCTGVNDISYAWNSQ